MSKPCTNQASAQPAGHRGRVIVQRMLGLSMLCALGLIAGCLPSAKERITCDDTSPPDATDFSQLVALISADTDKGCAAGECHGGHTQEQGLRLDSRSLIYEELTTRTDLIYAMIASGEMPARGTAWEDSDLRLFRSWYCNGALP